MADRSCRPSFSPRRISRQIEQRKLCGFPEGSQVQIDDPAVSPPSCTHLFGAPKIKLATCPTFAPKGHRHRAWRFSAREAALLFPKPRRGAGIEPGALAPGKQPSSSRSPEGAQAAFRHWHEKQLFRYPLPRTSTLETDTASSRGLPRKTYGHHIRQSPLPRCLFDQESYSFDPRGRQSTHLRVHRRNYPWRRRNPARGRRNARSRPYPGQVQDRYRRLDDAPENQGQVLEMAQ